MPFPPPVALPTRCVVWVRPRDSDMDQTWHNLVNTWIMVSRTADLLKSLERPGVPWYGLKKPENRWGFFGTATLPSCVMS